MAKALGVGGIFFKSRNPAALADWYRRCLDFAIDSNGTAARFRPASLPAAAYAVWAPFPQDTEYFAPSDTGFMLNLIVDDLDQVLAKIREGGGHQVGGIGQYPYGRFAWFLDPDANKVELWEPSAGKAPLEE